MILGVRQILQQLFASFFMNIRLSNVELVWGWSGGAMVLRKLSVPERPATLNNSRTRAYCACCRCGWELYYLSLSLSLSLGDGPI